MMYSVPFEEVNASEYEKEIKGYLDTKSDVNSVVSPQEVVRSFWRVFELVLNSCQQMKHCHGEPIGYFSVLDEKISSKKICIKGKLSWEDMYGARFSFFQIDIDRRSPKLLYSIKILRRSTKVQKQSIYIGKTHSDWLVGYRAIDFELEAYGPDLYSPGEYRARRLEEYDPGFNDLEEFRKRREKLRESK
ncbi:hypothetical protein AUP74_03043 [Microbulbifer aggregans]|uniref:Uncharacterized protein n=1 Tax=Microbulbifer aggregans TaxID=1769779 RepID=A0A1C9WB95_9GAMM|nr:hypothetical protein [Microbulbifer aggregans]AOS98409.1 hypothetical protein AUP74_03043 [Microbulbifer aggregans]